MKTQEIRLIDVFLLGPFLIWAGLQKKRLSKTSQLLLIGGGVATIIYNAKNFLEVKQITE